MGSVKDTEGPRIDHFSLSTVIGSYEIHTRTMGLLKGPAWSIFAVYATFLGGFMSIEVPRVSNAFKCFPKVTTRYWLVFQLF